MSMPTLAGGAPEKLLVLMEGESLFNDATSIVLFEIFFSMVKRKQKGHPSTLGFLEQAAEIFSKIAWLAFGAWASTCCGPPLSNARYLLVEKGTGLL